MNDRDTLTSIWYIIIMMCFFKWVSSSMKWITVIEVEQLGQKGGLLCCSSTHMGK